MAPPPPHALTIRRPRPTAHAERGYVDPFRPQISRRDDWSDLRVNLPPESGRTPSEYDVQPNGQSTVTFGVQMLTDQLNTGLELDKRAPLPIALPGARDSDDQV